MSAAKYILNTNMHRASGKTSTPRRPHSFVPQILKLVIVFNSVSHWSDARSTYVHRFQLINAMAAILSNDQVQWSNLISARSRFFHSIFHSFSQFPQMSLRIAKCFIYHMKDLKSGYLILLRERAWLPLKDSHALSLCQNKCPLFRSFI